MTYDNNSNRIMTYDNSKAIMTYNKNKNNGIMMTIIVTEL